MRKAEATKKKIQVSICNTIQAANEVVEYTKEI